jgi:Flp pilus assembly protein TadG
MVRISMRSKSIIQYRRPRSKKAEQGSYLIESGLCFVTFFVILLGILDVGRGIYSYNFISAAAKEGTRYAMVHGNSSGSIASASDVQNVVRGWLIGVLGADSATVTTTWTPDNKPGSLVQVQVQCAYTPISSLLVGNWTLKSSSKRMIVQ